MYRVHRQQLQLPCSLWITYRSHSALGNNDVLDGMDVALSCMLRALAALSPTRPAKCFPGFFGEHIWQTKTRPTHIMYGMHDRYVVHDIDVKQ